jgi:hypothetical protein
MRLPVSDLRFFRMELSLHSLSELNSKEQLYSCPIAHSSSYFYSGTCIKISKLKAWLLFRSSMTLLRLIFMKQSRSLARTFK